MEPSAAKFVEATTRINLWAAPRSLSTSLMYSFANRADTTAIDEPLYAHHLRCAPHIERPYRDELLKTMCSDGATVVRDVMLGSCPTPILFCKQMAKQAMDLDMSWATQVASCMILADIYLCNFCSSDPACFPHP